MTATWPWSCCSPAGPPSASKARASSAGSAISASRGRRSSGLPIPATTPRPDILTSPDPRTRRAPPVTLSRDWNSQVTGNEKLILALPNGRILEEVMPLLRQAGIEPEPEFDNPNTRKLQFATSHAGLDIIRTRAFDVATFVAFGAAHLA